MSRSFLAAVIGVASIAACSRPTPAIPVAPSGSGLVVVNPVGDRPTFFDLGTIPYGQAAEHVFRIRNDDAVPVTVRDLLPSCGCAQPRIAYTAADGAIISGDPSGGEKVITLPPKSVADLKVSIDTERVEVVNRDKLAEVRLRCDSKSTPYIHFEVHLVVTRAMLAVPPQIELGQTPQSAGKSGSADVMVDVLKSKYRVFGIESIEGPFTATVDENEVAGVPTWVVVASAKPGLQLGPAFGKIVLSVSGEDGTGKGLPFKVPVTAQIVPDVVLQPPVLQFGTIERGKGKTLTAELVALVPGSKVRVTGTKLASTPESAAKELTVETKPIDAGEDGRAERWSVVLSAGEKVVDDAFSGTLTIETDDPRVPLLRVPFSGVSR